MIKPSQSVEFYFGVQTPSTGAAVNADSSPTVVVYKNGAVDVAVTPTVTNPATGSYKVVFTVPSGYSAGDRVEVLATATLSSVASPPTRVFRDNVDSVRHADFVDENNRVDVGKWLGQAVQTAVNGIPKVDLTHILGTALTETAGQIAAAVKKFFDVAAPTGTVNSLPDAIPAATGGLITRGTGTGQLSVSGGRAEANVARWNNNALSGSDSFEVTVRAAVLLAESADFSDPAYIGGAIVAGGSGSRLGAGAISYPAIVTDSSGNPLDGVEVWISTDQAGANVIASGTTDASGLVTFMLDAGSYWLWRQLAGYNFQNPYPITVTA